ncbi:MAG: hypothetical protein U0S13_08330 [Mycobacterium sp.]|jgi:hypothetical protein
MLGEPGVRVLVHALYSTAIVVAAALLAAALSSLPAQRAEVWPAPPERAVIIVNPSGAALDARDARRCGPVCDPDVAGGSETVLPNGSAGTPAADQSFDGQGPR